MSFWIVQSFGVAAPEERLGEIRERLPLEDTVGVVSTADEPPDVSDTVQTTVLALITSGLPLEEMDRIAQVRTDDLALFGPYMSAVLEPGEYGCVLLRDDTTDTGSGHVYRKRPADGRTEVVEAVADDGRGHGRRAVEKVAREFGFKPARKGRWNLIDEMARQGDPYVEYKRVLELERDPHDEWFQRDPRASGVCPGCGAGRSATEDGIEVVEGLDRDAHDLPYVTRYACTQCEWWRDRFDPGKVPDPSRPCPECGAEFSPRTLQYPSIGSTAFECEGCGEVTFDIASLSDAERHPDDERETDIEPNVALYRRREGADRDTDETVYEEAIDRWGPL